MRFFSDLVKTIGAMLLVCVFFELGLRVTGTKYESSFYESDSVLYTTLRPNAHGWEAKEGENFVQINSWGMRDRERSLTPEPGTLRIALLGDSMIAAEQVPLEKTIAQVMEAKLNEEFAPSHHSAEVLNFGVGGHTLAQELLTLQTRVWPFHPTIVILFLSPSSVPSCDRRLYPGNFPFFVIRNGHVVPDPRNHSPSASSPGARQRHAFMGDLMNNIRLLQMVRKATQEGIPHEVTKITSRKPYRNNNIIEMWLKPPSSTAQKDAWQVAEGVLALMSQEARDHGAELWLSAIGPEIEENPNADQRTSFLSSEKVERFGYAEDRLQAIVTSHDLRFISLEPRMLEFAERNQVSLHGFFNTRANFGHWNEQGHVIAAAIVLESLSRESNELNRFRTSNALVAKTPATMLKQGAGD